ncbi:MAG TPA: DUF222 domain-containing protein [Terrimesophilobacter sp.]|nr:DUF222 domain-containing protein [Terrimesophilobacter sp.]
MEIEQNIEIPVDPHADDVDAAFDFLVGQLSGISPFQDAVERLAQLDREEAARFAERSQIYAQLVSQNLAAQGKGGSLDLAFRSLAAELAVSMKLSDRTMQSRLSEAVSLMVDFPFTHHALQSGTVTVAHARVVMAEGAVISDTQRRIDYESAVLERAASVTPGRLRRLAKFAAEKLADIGFDERHEKAVEERSVRSFETLDGMSEVVAVVPTVLAAGILDRLTQMGKAVKAANPADPRMLDQLRADLFCDLLLTGHANGEPHAGLDAIHAEIAIVIPALTLLGEGNEPASILGRGPIGLVDAQRMAASVPSMVRIITDPVTDQVLSTTNYQPGKKLRRYLRMRDGRCRFPSCNRSPRRCEIDHTIPYSKGGATDVGNLAHLCKGHHDIKHFPGWTVRHSEPGVLEWVTPHGIVVADRPDTPVRFTED